MRCNICNSRNFGSHRDIENIRCLDCNSIERSRLMFALIERLGQLQRGLRCLHITPEIGLSARLKSVFGAGYDPVDIAPERYPHVRTRRFDLCTDVFRLPDQHYDLILHNHVLEHIPCDFRVVFRELRRSLRIGGVHVFSVPVTRGTYAEHFGPMDEAERVREFGQNDHVRRFGRADFGESIGTLVDLANAGTWDQTFTPDRLSELSVRSTRWKSGPILMIACTRTSNDVMERDQLLAPTKDGIRTGFEPVRPRPWHARLRSRFGWR